MLRCAICEDEPEMAARLASLLRDALAAAGQPAAIEQFSAGRALLAQGREYDLVLLDIRLDGGAPGPRADAAARADKTSGTPETAPAPEAAPPPPAAPSPAASPEDAPPPPAPLDGMQTARLLRARGSRCLVIFVTALREPVFDAFAVGAFDYLTKPIDPARFSAVLARALRVLAARGRQTLVLPRAGGCDLLPLDQLLWCEVQGHRLYLHRLDGAVLDLPGRIRELESQLDGRFFRCHRSYLINLDHLQGFGGGLARLPQGGRVPVSRLRERELAAALLRRMRQREETR